MTFKELHRRALSSVGIFLLAAIATAADKPELFTYSNLQLKKDHLSLQIEILPELLRQAGVIANLSGEGQMTQAEWHEAKSAILAYIHRHFAVTLNGRLLKCDSAAVMFRFLETASSPDRIYVSRAYALLLKPEHLKLRNDMFNELGVSVRHRGVLGYGERLLEFEFSPDETHAQPVVEIAVSRSGELEWLNAASTSSRPAMMWMSAGVGGLLLLGVVARMRRVLRRRARRLKRAIHSEESQHVPGAPRRKVKYESAAA